ncbi:hypothetical protein FRB90_006802 [Tulasnella sp. 427]|nr:hypothetical protein FRB90_006802 [Tulasnella sp. 427]
MIPQWFWIILCTLTVSTVSFVLGSRVWAIYERDRRVLFGLLVWFMACFVPSWTLTFLAGVRGGYDEDEIRVFTNVWQYIGGIVSSSILIGSLAYETGICAAMIWRMYHDKKKTRIIEAFYRDGVAYYLVMLCTYASAIGLSFAFKNPIAQGFLTYVEYYVSAGITNAYEMLTSSCAWYAAVKSMICSHIILRLRSYFTEGDPIVDGHDPADPFQGQLEGKQYDTSSSLVSTTIHFAHPIARSGGDVVLELRSLPSANSIQPARHIQDTVLDENKDEFPVTSTVLSSPRSRLQQVLDWTDGPDPLRRCSILGQPSSWNQAGDIGPLAERQLRRLHKQAESSGSEQNGRQRFAPSRDHTRLLSARSLQELQPAVRRGDMTRVSSSAAPRRTTSHANRPVGNDSAPLSTAKSQNLPSKGASSVVQVDVRQRIGMLSSNGASRTIWQLSPDELQVLKSDVEGYLDGLQITHIAFLATATLLAWDIITTWDREAHYVWKSRGSYAKAIFLINRYMAPIAYFCVITAWFGIILSTLTATTISFILAARLWALYERDRRVLGALILGFLTCFVPGWTLTFKAGASSIDAEQLRVIGNVYTYIGGVAMQEGYDALDWRLKKCFHFRFLKVSSSIVIGSLLFESGIFAALIWKMCQDQKRTRILEAFYRDGIAYYLVMFCNYAVALGTGFAWSNPLAQAFLTSSFYVGIKSMMCSHIILRLRSYFSHGDPVVDGPSESDQFNHDGGKVGGGDLNSLSMVSTVIRFATIATRQEREELRSTHAIRVGERPNADFGGGARREEDAMRSAGTAAGRTRPSSLSSGMVLPPLDWIDAPAPIESRTGTGDASEQDYIGAGPSLQPTARTRQWKRSRWFRRQPPDPSRSEGAWSSSLRHLAGLAYHDESSAIVELDDMRGAFKQEVSPERGSLGRLHPPRRTEGVGT